MAANRKPEFADRQDADRQDAHRQDDRVLVITRVFDAPPSAVFKAWRDPAAARSWMGPRGFTATHIEGDLRPGGAWRLCLRRDEDGKELWQGGVYREIVEPERLVFTSAALDEKGKALFEVLTTVSFDEQGGKTKLTLRASVAKATAEAAPYLAGMEVGWNQSLDRLGRQVES